MTLSVSAGGEGENRIYRTVSGDGAGGHRRGRTGSVSQSVSQSGDDGDDEKSPELGQFGREG